MRDGSAPTVVGKDWTSVLVARGVPKSALTGGSDSAIASSLLNGFRPVSGSYGSGRALQTSLLSALWLDDGRVLVGAVPVKTLEAAAATDSAAR
ncbi:hypothetical protein GCM10025868_17340 [Angustibacter aerolatus]|uniref:Uncharacterized protein n=1 Tax=Angustibacter aerolatus TaxID=1162965 RepID=A0ABQ6JGH3_9ACTN|nr:hypothetical protein GCM10025868_17340 [Angustibacter aerolatus]